MIIREMNVISKTAQEPNATSEQRRVLLVKAFSMKKLKCSVVQDMKAFGQSKWKNLTVLYNEQTKNDILIILLSGSHDSHYVLEINPEDKAFLEP